MGGGNQLWQEVPTVAGGTYVLTFDWGSEYAWGVNGEVQFSDSRTNLTVALVDERRVSYPQIGDTQWIVHQKTITFTGNGPGVLRFTQLETGDPDRDFGGLVVDNVRLQKVN